MSSTTIRAAALNPGLTDIDRAIQRILAGRAATADPGDPMGALITYTDLCAQADPERRYFTPPRHRGIGPALQRIAIADKAAGRPRLPSLVSLKGERRPGDGYWIGLRELGTDVADGDMTFWRDQVGKVIGYWSGRDVDATLNPAPEPVPVLTREGGLVVADAVVAAVAEYGAAAVLAHLAIIGAFHDQSPDAEAWDTPAWDAIVRLQAVHGDGYIQQLAEVAPGFARLQAFRQPKAS